MKLLIVSPRFPPTTAADSQRVRMLLPHFAEASCNVEVLAVDPLCCGEGVDPWQAEHLPAGIQIHRVRGLSRGWARLPGLGSLDARCHRAIASAGSRLLRRGRFDLVYFSTAEFGTFRLGLLWKRRYGIPFVLDYQDPWVNDHYRRHPEITPPGGRLKYAVVDHLHRLQEPRVLSHASGITAVSAAYPAQLQARYPFAAAIPSLVLPFPGSEEDFQRLGTIPASHLPFDPQDGLIHWVCIGRADASLFQLTLSSLFQAISRFAPHDLRQRLRIHFLGTSYAPTGQGIPTIGPLAARYGLETLVEERTDRMPLSLSLASLKVADALLVLGSNDPGYTASKLVPYLLARRPLLAVIHEQSVVCELLERCGGGQLVRFSSHTPTAELSDRIAKCWLASNRHAQLLPLDRTALRPHTAAGQTDQLVAFLRRCL